MSGDVSRIEFGPAQARNEDSRAGLQTLDVGHAPADNDGLRLEVKASRCKAQSCGKDTDLMSLDAKLPLEGFGFFS